ncbi:unnamed protein product, partial [Prorocentrum cordatum]
MGGNWMNITQLKEYTHPSGRLKSRYLTKLFMSNHNRAMIYIKRLQCLGLMPYHRIQAKMANDPAALPPPPKVQFNSGGERPAQSRQLLDRAGRGGRHLSAASSAAPGRGSPPPTAPQRICDSAKGRRSTRERKTLPATCDGGSNPRHLLLLLP